MLNPPKQYAGCIGLADFLLLQISDWAHYRQEANVNIYSALCLYVISYIRAETKLQKAQGKISGACAVF